MRIPGAILFIFISLQASSAGTDLTVQIDDLNSCNISGRLSSYVCGQQSPDVSLAFLYYCAGKFLAVPATNNEYINDGLVNAEKWYALPLQNSTNINKTVVLEFIASGMNKISCYAINDMQQINTVNPSEKTVSPSSRTLFSRPIIFNILVGADERNLILIHTINKGQLLYIPVTLYAIGPFGKYETNKNNFFGIFEGIFLFIILFNFLLYISTFDRIYLFYLLYAFFIGLFALCDAGAAPLNFKPVSLFSGQTYLFTGFAAWLFLMLLFLDLSKSNFIFYRLLRILAGIDLALAMIPFVLKLAGVDETTPIQTIYQSALNILFAANLLFIIITNISRLSYKNKLAIFYGIANIPVILGTLLYYTNYYHFTNVQFGWLNPIALGLSIETFALSFGFAYRYNLIGTEKRQLLLHINKQQKEISQQMIDAQEAEQKRIACDLHDELGGNLAAIKMKLQSFELPRQQSGLLQELIDKASANARNIAHNLMPPEFEHVRLNTLLINYYQQLSNDNTCKFTFYSSGNDHHFNKQEELMIYRILLELSNNILKHASATEATVQLIYYENKLEIVVEDNGRGFAADGVKGIGLRNISSRIKYLAGEINIDSGKSGTTIMIQIPYL